MASSAVQSPASGAERPERLQPRVDVVVGVIVLALVERQRRRSTQRPGQSVAAERRDRLGEQDRFADRALEVELVVVGQADDVIRLLGREPDGLAGLEVDRRQGLLLELERRSGRRCRAGSASTPRRERRVRCRRRRGGRGSSG